MMHMPSPLRQECQTPCKEPVLRPLSALDTPPKRSLQGGTSHNFGNGFAKAFDIQFLDNDNTLKYAYETSWGVSTRIIGGIIMTHGDDSGLVLPPSVAPIQVVVIPVQQHKEGVLDAANALADTLRAAGIRVKVDDSEQSPGWKFSEYEMMSAPSIRISPSV